ncbi:hypothetical protein CBL_10381 [Carabus blaptoides fortunei]
MLHFFTKKRIKFLCDAFNSYGQENIMGIGCHDTQVPEEHCTDASVNKKPEDSPGIAHSNNVILLIILIQSKHVQKAAMCVNAVGTIASSARHTVSMHSFKIRHPGISQLHGLQSRPKQFGQNSEYPL